MNITEKQLAARVALWQERMADTGVGSWRVDSVNKVDESPSGPDALASVQTSNRYDSCSFWFTNEFLADADDQTLDETIVHEWLHVAMRNFDNAIDAAAFELSSGSRYQWNDRVDHEREGLIDRLSRLICSHYE